MSSEIKLSNTSVREYAYMINRIEGEGYDTDNIESIKKFFEDKEYSVPTKRTYISAIINKHKDNTVLRNQLREYLVTLNEILKKSKESGKPSERQQKKHLEWNKVIERSNKYIADARNKLENRIIVALYTLLKPVRNDYISCRLYKTDPKLKTGTYFIINDSIQEVVINEYKESKAHGPIRQKLPIQLTDLLLSWFHTADSVLFPILETNFGKKVQRAFMEAVQVPMGCCALRHSYATYIFKDSPMPLEARQIAKDMGHSVATQQSYRFAPT